MTHDHFTSRQQRRHAERLARKKHAADERADLIRRAAELAETDSSISGVTIITPDGTVDYIDAGALRRGGRA